MQTFDGFEALAVEQAAPPALPSSVGVAEAAGGGEMPLSLPAPPQTGASAPAETPSAATQARSSQVARAPAPAPKPSPVAGVKEESLQSVAAPRSFWTSGTILLIVLLLVQVSYVYRSELAARSALVRSALSEICDLVGCTVTLPQRPDLVKIEASDVHVIDVTRPGLIQLTATLRSYASYDLAYPALDLVLTNTNEHALARRIFVPDEYLDPTRDPKRGISPNAEITVALDLDTSDLNAAGFRLDLLAAPAP
jgi:hypothetical protein